MMRAKARLLLSWRQEREEPGQAWEEPWKTFQNSPSRFIGDIPRPFRRDIDTATVVPVAEEMKNITCGSSGSGGSSKHFRPRGDNDRNEGNESSLGGGNDHSAESGAAKGTHARAASETPPEHSDSVGREASTWISRGSELGAASGPEYQRGARSGGRGAECGLDDAGDRAGVRYTVGVLRDGGRRTERGSKRGAAPRTAPLVVSAPQKNSELPPWIAVGAYVRRKLGRGAMRGCSNLGAQTACSGEARAQQKC